MEDGTITELLGVPWDRLTEQHRQMARTLLGDPEVTDKEKAAHWAVHLLSSGSGDPYDKSLRTTLRRRANVMLRDLAERGDVESQLWLGESLLLGDGITKDAHGARTWLERALEQGEARAAYVLGYLYEYRRGDIPRDLERSREYFRLAEEMGYRPELG